MPRTYVQVFGSWGDFVPTDSTAPTLSNPNNGTETADGTTAPSVDTNEGGGTLYWAVLTNGGSCTDAQLKAGSGGNIIGGQAGNQAVSGTGTQVTSNITGLSAATDYEIVWLHRDASGNDSSQATIGLTTTAGAVTPSRTGFTTADANLGDGSTSVTIPANTNLVVAFWAGFDSGDTDRLTTLTLGGQSFTERAGVNCDGVSITGGYVGTCINSGVGSQTLAWTYGTDHGWGNSGRIYLVFYQNGNTADPFRAAGADAEDGTDPVEVLLTSTVASDRVVSFCVSDDNTSTLTQVTQFITDETYNAYQHFAGDATGLTGTVDLDVTNPSFVTLLGISLKAS